ncbi:uncharacterized protein E5676_scaffold1784G00270 [Cucumis melo var. makuwa]|uniref:Acidic leucine-rich nuclear phosphoprotein 32 family member A-like n=1 Tax=Cucumis melo var. makuwa TaxID=1194695 RepID=A0A5A7T330_CUCMM|nr:uncharacterized protein E6C27_scaffold471G00260 [Cucumis melo var. makuwa]TYK27312.1 uncharacterized protein E5676_scaffold1784G00270 [Cucumis melo var. makuwa]
MFHFWFAKECNPAYRVFYLEDPKNGTNWKIVQVVQNKRILDVLEVEDIENEQFNVLEIVVEHRVDEPIEDGTLYRAKIDSTVVERPDVHHDDDDEQLSSPPRGSSDDE